MVSWMEVLVLLFRSPLWPKFSMSSWVEQDVPQPLPCWAGRGRSKRRQLHYGPSLFWQQDSHSSLALFQVISYRPTGKSTRTGESIKGFLQTFSGGGSWDRNSKVRKNANLSELDLPSVPVAGCLLFLATSAGRFGSPCAAHRRKRAPGRRCLHRARFHCVALGQKSIATG